MFRKLPRFCTNRFLERFQHREPSNCQHQHNLATTLKDLVKMSQHKRSKEKPFTIVVEGNIGSGKTTFLDNFVDLRDQVEVLSEPVDKWRDVKGYNLLNLMYTDPSRYSFLFQSYVQLTMLQQHVQSSGKPIKIMERSLLRNYNRICFKNLCQCFFNARHCFVENLFGQKKISDVEVVVLTEWFNFLVTCPQFDFHADLIVYLQTRPEIAFQRILKRCRFEENNISFDYIKSLHELHEDWLVRKTKFQPIGAPVLVIDANEDLSDLSNKYADCKEEILKIANKKTSRN